MAPEESQPQSCSKCSQPLDAEGYPKWCKACRAKWKREFEATRKEMAETRGYAAGISAMREHLAKQFARLGQAQFQGWQAAGWVRNAKGPE